MLNHLDRGPTGVEAVGQPSPAHLFITILAFVATAIGAGVTGFVVFDLSPNLAVRNAPISVSAIFGVMGAVVFILTILVVNRVWDLYIKQELSGARMHRRLAGLLSAVSLLPATVAFALTGLLIGSLSDEFFVDRIEKSSEVARNLANAYAEGVSRQMGFNLLLAERELSLAMANGISPDGAPIGYRKYLSGLSVIYQFGGLTHVSFDGRIIAQTTIGNFPVQPLPPLSALSAESGVEGVARASFGAVDPDTLEVYYVVVPVGGEQGYLVGYRAENARIAAELLDVRELRDDDRRLQRRIADLSSVANFGFSLLSVILLMAAALIGLTVANAVVRPVRRLATAAERVSEGDLSSRVDVREQDGELAELGQAFNTMTEQLAQQREELIAAGEDAENRRRFVETMLGVIPAGVISVNRDGEVGLANPSAAAILGPGPQEIRGRRLSDIIPSVERLFIQAQRGSRGVRESLEWDRNGELRTLVVEISPETEHGPENHGFVVTIEDITDLLTAQRTAAWADVARRIAHEIKNPLTPIQLSAERLRRRYASELEGRDREIFDQCTATIIKHVGDIGRMVTEFSSFARMPEPKLGENDLREIAREALFPFAVAHPDITFVSHMPPQPVKVSCDNRLMVQALTNLIKNAAEAISEAPLHKDGQVEISVEENETTARVQIRDNGKGLPARLRHRLTEPYMTTREKGTGLGLAIVRKAIEDHGGRFDIRNNPAGGAIASVSLPLLPDAAETTSPSSPRVSQEKAEPVHGD